MDHEQTPERNKATIRRWGEQIWNAGNFSETANLLTHDFVCHRPGGLGEIHGREAHDRWVSGIREQNPDLRVVILDLIAEGDKVASSWWGSGPGMHFYRFRDGKIAEMWTIVGQPDT